MGSMHGARRLLRFGILLLPAFLAGLINALARNQQAIVTVEGDRISAAPEFEAFWNSMGGMGTVGPPIDQPRREGSILRQFFLSVELVLSPAGDVGLAPLGWELGLARPAVTASGDPAEIYFADTGHSLYPGFSQFVGQLGGTTVTGPPIREVEFKEGQILQYFSNLGLYREDTAAPSEVHLLTLGLEAQRHRATNSAASSGPRLAGEQPVASQPFKGTVDLLGGEALFGQPVSEPYLAPDGSTEQVYERAVFYAPSGRPEELGLRAVGYRIAPVTPPVERLDEPGSLYFKETGHNIMWAFADFYRAHDGGRILGLPLTEAELEGDRFTQRFENATLLYRFDLPANMAVQLAPLDPEFVKQVLDVSSRNGLESPTAESVPPSPQPLVVKTWVDHPILTIGDLQRIHLQVSQADGSACVGEPALVTIAGPRTSVIIQSPQTDAQGMAELSVSIGDLRPAEIVNYDVTLSGRCGMGSASGQFAAKGTTD